MRSGTRSESRSGDTFPEPRLSDELVDVRREAALLDLLLHLLEHQDPPIGWRVRAEEFIRAPPVALPLLLDRLPQFVRVDLAVLIEVVGAHLLPHLIAIVRRLHRIADHEGAQ